MIGEYYSCSYLEESIVFYYDDLIHTCCYMSYIPKEGLLGSFENGNLEVEKLIANKKKLIMKKIAGDLGGCSKCPKLHKKIWRSDDVIKIKNVTLNHFMMCNLKCSYCGYVKIRHLTKDTDSDLVMKTIRNLEEKGFISKETVFGIGGGEPSFNKKIDEIVRYLLKKNYLISVKTNGTVLNDVYITGVNQGKLRLTIDPDAAQESSYKKIKGRNFFKTVWGNIRSYAEQTNGQIFIKIVLQNDNLFEVNNLIMCCMESKIKKLIIDIDINLNGKINSDYISYLDIFYLSKKESISIKLGTHWPKEIIQKYAKT